MLTKWWLVHTLASLLLLSSLLFVWLCASGGPAHLFDFVGFVQFMQNNKSSVQFNSLASLFERNPGSSSLSRFSSAILYKTSLYSS